MSMLVVLPDAGPATDLLRTSDADEIAAALADVGVVFERWKASHLLAGDADQAAVIDAYRSDVERICAEGGYVTVDVVRLHRAEADDDSAWAEKAAQARGRFLAEHTHDDDEVRLFVEGAGAFYLRIGGRVHIALCERGDFISVPANTTHWFDMGTNPSFAAIRFFKVPEGWVGNFTGDDIATRFPTFDALRS